MFIIIHTSSAKNQEQVRDATVGLYKDAGRASETIQSFWLHALHSQPVSEVLRQS